MQQSSIHSYYSSHIETKDFDSPMNWGYELISYLISTDITTAYI